MKPDGTERAHTTLPAALSSVDVTRPRETPRSDERGSAAASRLLDAPHHRDPDRYQIISEHGRGGLGLVSRVHDRDLDRDIAIKELISRDPLSERRFVREALITARLEHPGIVPVYEAGRWPDGTPFYAMKLVSGRSLRELLAERGVEHRLELLHHVVAVADAIAYAHGRNIVHRDLKPGNVIVGDFGETIVIDWGLAKDLTAADETTTGTATVRTGRDDDLTVTGHVLGTPMYMAPEQARGERVDQRADVFAIGAMLWELCAIQRVPPVEPRRRHRLLRSAGIDRDLVTIIDKATHPDPARRYADAGELAADLKSFKDGARIAGRSYSPLAVVTHWVRRHHTLALSVAAVLLVIVTGSVVSIRNIALERDRADASEQVAERSKSAVQASLGELTLKHAELLLTTDPSAAVDLLATYDGGRRARADQLRAEAVGRGVATIRVAPHTDRIRWASGAPDGTIVSLSSDGTIRRTWRDGRTTVLTTGVSSRGMLAYAGARGLLAYECDPADVCLWDVARGVRIPLAPAFRGWQLAGIVFSPDESKLALLAHAGRIAVFDVSAPANPSKALEVQRDHAIGVLFVDDTTLAIGIADTLALELHRLTGEVETVVVHDYFLWEASPREHRIMLATQRGEGLYLQTAPLRIVDRLPLCQGLPTGLKLIPGKRTLAFSCREGTVGTWDLKARTATPITHLDGHADAIAVSQDGDYLVAVGGNGAVVVIDLVTQLITSYRGHSFRVTAVSTPTANARYFISADIRGALRTWPLPNRIARVVSNVHSRFMSAIFNSIAHSVLATTLWPEITVVSSNYKTRTISPHIDTARFLELANDGRIFAAYGAGDSVELWSSDSLSRQRVVKTGQSTVSRVVFRDQADDFVTAGRDGSLIYWSSTGERQRALKLASPISDVALVHYGKYAVISTADGELWQADDQGRITRLPGVGASVAKLSSIPDTASVGISYTNGDVEILDTESRQTTRVLHTSRRPRDIAFTRDGRTVAIADDDDAVHVGQLDIGAWSDQHVRWTTFAARARTVALTPDGIVVALCSDGTVWLYAPSGQKWLYLFTGTADLNGIAMSQDGSAAVTFDTDGRIIWINLDLARQSIVTTFNHFSEELTEK